MNVMDSLWTYYRRRPFAPFTMVLKDGRRVLIHRTMQFAFNERTVSVFDDGDRRVVFKPSDIVRFEELYSVGSP